MGVSVEAALTGVRALHFAAAIALFGVFAFAAFVRPVRVTAIAGWSLALAVLTALAWLGLEAGNMSGMPVGEALRAGTARIVLARTQFGHVWLVRGALALALAAALVAMRRGGGIALQAFGFACALLFLAALAWTGHAAADGGGAGWLHLASDALHLVAAGAWLGALAPLAMTLRECAGRGAEGLAAASQAALRFSLLGQAAVGALALTGLVNACCMLHSFPALLETRYGLELVVKIALFGAMVAFAAVNRLRLTPRLAGREPAALRALSRNTLAEIALGLAIVAIVGNLGVTMPPMPAS